jgi:Mn-containing catalase
MRGPWNQGEKWQFVSDREQQAAVDGGSGDASVMLSDKEAEVLNAMAVRTQSNPNADPLTGAEIGMAAGNGVNGNGLPSATNAPD